MPITVASILIVAWASAVLGAASHHGRVLGRGHRVAFTVGAVGVLLVLPVLILGTFGLPAGWSFRWLGVIARIGYGGMTLVVAGAAGWLLLDTAFVCRERRRIFPFACRRRAGSATRPVEDRDRPVDA